jgi:hypothetical protein
MQAHLLRLETSILKSTVCKIAVFLLLISNKHFFKISKLIRVSVSFWHQDQIFNPLFKAMPRQSHKHFDILFQMIFFSEYL